MNTIADLVLQINEDQARVRKLRFDLRFAQPGDRVQALSRYLEAVHGVASTQRAYGRRVKIHCSELRAANRLTALATARLARRLELRLTPT